MQLNNDVRVYVAGPLFGSGRSTQNVRNALAVAERVRYFGAFPFVPHLFHLWDTVFPHEGEYWLGMDKVWLATCDLLVVLPGVSPGTRMEEEWAKELGIPIFTLSGDLNDLLNKAWGPLHTKIMNLQKAKLERPENIGFRQLINTAHNTAINKGWWKDWAALAELRLQQTDKIAALLALVHTEVSEAVEDLRVTDPAHLPKRRISDSGKPEGFATELADVIIRVMDLSAGLGIDLTAAVQEKMEYNSTRPMRHGGKKL